MDRCYQDVLNCLTTPVWVISPATEAIVFANVAAQKLAGEFSLQMLRAGLYSTCTCERLQSYLPRLQAKEKVIEVWTVPGSAQIAALCCHLSFIRLAGEEPGILVEGTPEKVAVTRSSQEGRFCKAVLCQDERSFYDRLFQTNTAPMLLIDPEEDGRIVDANRAASDFYGYSREAFCQMHTWEINALGRDVLPIMEEVSKLPGGHKPLNFVHRLADGSTRNVQTYSGPMELDGRRLMLCMIHDITEQKRLERELEAAAMPRPAHRFVEQAPVHVSARYCSCAKTALRTGFLSAAD